MTEAIIILLAFGLLWVVLSKFEEKKLVECKTCGKEISKKAKDCPYCGERNRSPLQTIMNIALVIFVVYTALSYARPKLTVSLVPVTTTNSLPDKSFSVDH